MTHITYAAPLFSYKILKTLCAGYMINTCLQNKGIIYLLFGILVLPDE